MEPVITVLLVEDHKIVREGFRAILEKEPCIAVIADAENGHDGVRLARELQPDVLIMDISMPDISGIEAIRQIKATNPLQKALILSMHRELRFIIEVFRLGVLGYLPKNCSPQELFLAIRTVASGDMYYDQEISEGLFKDYLNRSPEQLPTVCSNLSGREREVLQMIADGMNAKEVAYRLNVSLKTIEFHRMQIMKKLNLFSLAELTKYAIREGLTSL